MVLPSGEAKEGSDSEDGEDDPEKAVQKEDDELEEGSRALLSVGATMFASLMVNGSAEWNGHSSENGGHRREGIPDAMGDDLRGNSRRRARPSWLKGKLLRYG